MTKFNEQVACHFDVMEHLRHILRYELGFATRRFSYGIWYECRERDEYIFFPRLRRDEVKIWRGVVLVAPLHPTRIDWDGKPVTVIEGDKTYLFGPREYLLNFKTPNVSEVEKFERSYLREWMKQYLERRGWKCEKQWAYTWRNTSVHIWNGGVCIDSNDAAKTLYFDDDNVVSDFERLIERAES